MSINRIHHGSTASSKDYIKLRQLLVESWAVYLTKSEIAVCQFISRRTLYFAKDWELIPQRHFIKGVRKKDGEYLVHPCDVSTATLWRSIARLSKPDASGQVFIYKKAYRVPDGMGGLCVVNAYCLNQNYQHNTMALKTPRRKKETAPDEIPSWKFESDREGSTTVIEGVYQNDRGGSIKERDLTGNSNSYDNSYSKISGEAAAARAGSLKIPKKGIPTRPLYADNVEPVEECNDCTPPPKVLAPVPLPNKKKGTPLMQAQKLWMALEREFVSDNKEGMQLSPVIEWGKRELGMMGTLIRKWTEGGGDFEDFLELIRFSLTNWIRVTGSMNITNAYQPSLGLFVRCFTGFRDKKANPALLTAKRDEYREIVSTVKAARLMDRYKQTGQLAPEDEKDIARAVKKIRPVPIPGGHDDFAPKVVRSPYAPKTRQERLAEEKAAIAALGPAPVLEFDAEGMPICDPNLFTVPEFNHDA